MLNIPLTLALTLGLLGQQVAQQVTPLPLPDPVVVITDQERLVPRAEAERQYEELNAKVFLADADKRLYAALVMALGVGKITREADAICEYEVRQGLTDCLSAEEKRRRGIE